MGWVRKHLRGREEAEREVVELDETYADGVAHLDLPDQEGWCTGRTGCNEKRRMD